jgi:hypothetical protein
VQTTVADLLYFEDLMSSLALEHQNFHSFNTNISFLDAVALTYGLLLHVLR